MAEQTFADKLVSGTMKATGWSRDFSADVLGTAGGAVLAWFVVGIFPVPEVVQVIAAAVVAAMLWKRARRDNN
jgi:hypothetical protein